MNYSTNLIWFGSGGDIAICDNSNIERKSHCYGNACGTFGFP